MAVLGIETSCDETAVAVIDMDGRLLSNVLHSQAPVHAKHGGIVPELASRQHVLNISRIIKTSIQKSGLSWKEIRAIAVTYGPGLAGSLVVGLNTAKGLAEALRIPLVLVNHLEGHISAAWIHSAKEIEALLEQGTVLCLVASGGHTDLSLMRSRDKFESVGKTRDDAAGEAFDKCARLLGLGYPGGPEIQRAAERAKGFAEPFPRAMLKGSDDFSFSGLKTAVLHRVRAQGNVGGKDEWQKFAALIAREVQNAIVDVLVKKTVLTANRLGCLGVVVAGGVAANRALQNELKERCPVPVYIPPPDLCTDNGAMIAMRGLMLYKMGRRDGLEADVRPSLSLG